MRILAISGSLRATSINTALLRTVARLAPVGMTVTMCDVVGELPLFNPDLETAPNSVQRLWSQVQAADGLLIASPEYAHGVTGSIKNLLDWLVSFEPFVGKPVAVLNASSRAHLADAALKEILRTMSADIVEAACVTIPLLGANMLEGEMEQDGVVIKLIQQSLTAFSKNLNL